MDMLPEKSRIRVKLEKGVRKIIIPPRKSSCVFNGIVGTFIMFLLLSMHFRSIGGVSRVLNDIIWHHKPLDPLSNPAHFLLIVLGILVFILIFYITWREFAETFLLRSGDMVYDSRRRMVAFTREQLKTVRKKAAFTLEQLRTLKLSNHGGAKRLFIDYGNEKLELGLDVTDLEREWLYQVIKDHYSLGEKVKGGQMESGR